MTNQDDQRDYAEEAANRALMHETDEPDFEAEWRETAEKALEFYRFVASRTNAEICATGAVMYEHSKEALWEAIAMAYPKLDQSDMYDTAIDSGESLAECAQYMRDHGIVYLNRR